MSLLTKKIFLLIISVFIQTVQNTDYCNNQKDWECGDKVHIVCQRNNECGAISNCTETIESHKITQWALEVHNELRSNIAIGNETGKGLTNAANMNELIHDEELEYFAKCHVNRCVYNHDECPGIERFKKYGQNIHWNSGPRRDEFHVKQALKSWYNEIGDFVPEAIDFFTANTIPGKTYEHFTQVIWARSTHIGCAISEATNKNTFLVCNYGPPGNTLNWTVYERGSPCSKCPEGSTCSSKYPGLCSSESQLEAGMSCSLPHAVISIIYIPILIFILFFSPLFEWLN